MQFLYASFNLPKPTIGEEIFYRLKTIRGVGSELVSGVDILGLAEAVVLYKFLKIARVFMRRIVVLIN